MKNEKPILFSGEMVRAILEGCKTQTRRVIKHQPIRGNVYLTKDDNVWAAQTDRSVVTYFNCKHGWRGDRLWVKETFQLNTPPSGFIYRADDVSGHIQTRWKPSIFCTRKASRITLEITSVRVERLKDISEVDAKAEGITPRQYRDDTFWTNYLKGTKPKGGVDGEVIAFRSPIESYSSLWNSINGAGSWDANPWVWVIEFKKI